MIRRDFPPRILLAGLIGGLAVGCGVFLTATSGWLIVQASTQPVILTMLTAVVGVRAFGIGRPAFRYAERVISHDAALNTLKDRRTATYRGLIPLTPARLGRRRRADVLTAVVRDLDDDVDVQVRTIVPLLATVVATTAAVVVAFILNPTAGWVVVGFACVAILIGWLDFGLERRGQAQVLRARGRVERATHLIAFNTVAVQAIGAQNACLARVEQEQQALDAAIRRQARGRAVGVGLSLAVTGAATVALAALMVLPLRQGHVSAPVAVMLTFIPLALGDVLGMIPDAVGSLARGMAARRRMRRLLGQEPAVSSAALDAAPSTTPTLTLAGVSASWTPDAVHLPETDLVIEPGEHVTITGANGSGKSTLLAVLVRHLEPASGSYLVNGRDVRTLSLDGVRELFAVVDDDPHIFVGSVRANLLLARPDADDTQVARALVQAGLGRWLATLPDGLDTELGDGGRGISGGERARIGVARALLSRRPVIVLDEPVAHLDTPTARAVLDDLHSATEGSTVILVAHQEVGTHGSTRVVTLVDDHFPQVALPGRTP